MALELTAFELRDEINENLKVQIYRQPSVQPYRIKTGRYQRNQVSESTCEAKKIVTLCPSK